MSKAKQLRPRQETTFNELRAAVGAGIKRPMIQAPTGFGKTVLASHIIKEALKKGKRVMFCVPAISLIDQSVESFEADGINCIGVIQSNHPRTDYSQPVQVCSIQTIMRKRKLPDTDLVIIDEAHRWYKFYEKWFEQWNAMVFIGLSATPWTKGLGRHWQDLIIAATTAELIEEGLLSKFKVFAPSTPSMKGVRTVAGDYNESDLSTVMDDKELTADIVKTWKERADNRPTLCYGVDRAHAKHIQETFIANGVQAEYMDANTELMDRADICRGFQAGDVPVICNVGVLTTGIDMDVRCIILARPTKSEILFTQIIGRGLRNAPGKDHCLILDHSSTHSNLGFVTDIHHSTLNSGASAKAGKDAEKEEKLPTICPGQGCDAIKASGVHVCPECGFAPQKRTDVVNRDGELVEIKGKAAKKRNKDTPKADKQQMYSEFLAIARDQGYSDGWASHTYKKMFGVWPNAMDKVVAPYAGMASKSYVKSLQIAYAHRKTA